MAARTDALSRMSACSTSAPGGTGLIEALPRLRTVRSWPAATARQAHAELMIPVPPMNKIRSAVTLPSVVR
jgi:hypothetical protein